MGNVTDKDGSLSADVEDGEILYDTIARDIAYKRCTSKTEGAKPASGRSGGLRSSRRAVTVRSTSRAGKSIRRSLSRRRSNKERKQKAFRLSDMEVQVDGKVAKLVPRNSVLKKKGLSTLYARLNFINSRKSTKKNKAKKSVKTSSVQHLPVIPSTAAGKRPSYDAAMSSTTKEEDETRADVALDSPVKPTKKDTKRHSHADVFLATPVSPKSRSKSTYVGGSNNNNNNCNKTGNMALNIEKAMLRKMASKNADKEIHSMMDKLTIVSGTTEL